MRAEVEQPPKERPALLQRLMGLFGVAAGVGTGGPSSSAPPDGTPAAIWAQRAYDMAGVLAKLVSGSWGGTLQDWAAIAGPGVAGLATLALLVGQLRMAPAMRVPLPVLAAL